MSTEEQLQLAYAQIVELKEVISRLEAQLDPQREQRMREMYQAEARRTEDFYRKMMDDMRVEHARDMDRLTRTLTENLNAAHELQVKQLKDFIGFYTTDGYVVYKIFDTQDGGGPRRSACLVHIRRCFVDAIVEDHDTAMWFIEEIGKIFAIEYHCKKMGTSANDRLVERLKTGSTADIMAGIEARLKMYKASGYAECGALMAKAVKYALSEWPAMKRVLENGAVEISNNLAEQMMRHIKMNLKTAYNIGSENSALDNAFMFSLIESCKLNGLAPEKYIAFLLRKLKDADAYTDKNALLPCFCTV